MPPTLPSIGDAICHRAGRPGPPSPVRAGESSSTCLFRSRASAVAVRSRGAVPCPRRRIVRARAARDDRGGTRRGVRSLDHSPGLPGTAAVGPVAIPPARGPGPGPGRPTVTSQGRLASQKDLAAAAVPAARTSLAACHMARYRGCTHGGGARRELRHRRHRSLPCRPSGRARRSPDRLPEARPETLSGRASIARPSGGRMRHPLPGRQ